MTVRIINADCRDVLKTLPDESVHCVVTSPPYWGLRDYGTATWEGGDPACKHRVGGQVEDGKAPGAITSGQRPGVDASVCRSCGARRLDQQLGLESTPAEYVKKMVAVFREVRRVLRDDGTLWLNLGDSYARAGGWSNNNGLDGVATRQESDRAMSNIASDGGASQKLAQGLKSKDLVGIPWRVAFALQADGWYLRQDIIWSKPNPMPESVRDRCTKAHEYLFLLAKSERYYFDAEAIAEEAAYDGLPRRADSFMRKVETGTPPGQPPQHRDDREDISYSGTRNKRSVWTVTTQPFKEAHFATFPPALIEPCILAGCPEFTCVACGTAIDSIHENVRSRTNGQALENMQVVRRQGDAGPPQSSEELLQQGMCFSLDSEASLDHQRIHDNEQGIQGAAHAEASACVEPRLRVGTSSGDGTNAGTAADEERNCSSQERHQDRQSTRELGVDGEVGARQITQTEAQADQVSALSRVDRYGRSHCSKCKADLTASGAIKPGVVLDCFGGAGTTGLVADRMGRDAVLIELNPEYAAMAKRRIQGDSPLFAEVS